MEILLKFIIGGGLIVIITLIGKSKYPQLSGLIILFPAVTVIGYFFLISSIGSESVRPIVLFSIYSLPAVLAFLVTLYFTVNKFNTWHSIFLSIGAWLIVSGILIFLSKYFNLK